MREDGVLGSSTRKRFRSADEPLPPVCVLTVGDLDDEGDFLAIPENWDDELAPPTIRLSASGRFGGQIARGARVLARLAKDEAGHYEAKPIRVLPGLQRLRFVGVVRNNQGDAPHVVPTDRRQRGYFPIAHGGGGPKVSDGDLVSAIEVPTPQSQRGQRRGERGERTTRVRIEAVLGHVDATGAISLIALHSAGIPDTFPEPALAEAAQAKDPSLGDRWDLRDTPLVTIDGADARDFDDAVFAELLSEGRAAWRLLVAIADVGHYVAEGSALDKEAAKRGNSTYFPDRVVPMLPEALSNGLCSLRPGEDRAALVVEIFLSETGTILSHKFGRALIRSAARLIYEDVQAAIDGSPNETCAPVVESTIKPLFGVFEALKTARMERGALDLDLTEMKVSLADDGTVAGVDTRERLDAHRLIEECMIAANVCAAQTLGRRGRPCLYRNHEPPGPEKIAAARDFLTPFGYRLPKTGVVTNKHFTAILDRARETDEQALVNETILRAQSQARYGPDNLGHFGLGLSDYAHFTSPIRRYADL
ncbi:MAG: VacB/RNase II family 3'-5' exoribonuclease, partial [Pseudomonadota bacterium]